MKDKEELLALMELCGHFLYHRRGGKTGQARILRLLSEHETLTQRQLQDILNIKSGSLSEIVRKMEHDNLISRERHPEDRRNIIIRITEKGRFTCSQNLNLLKEQEKTLFSSLSQQEQAQLCELLSRLLDDWQSHFEHTLFEHRKHDPKK